MFCKNCGAQIDDGASFCPYCDAAVGGKYAGNAPDAYSSGDQRPKKRTNGWGVTGFVFALLGIFLGSFCGIVPAIAFICSVVGTALRHRRITCNALAVWELVLSIISLIGWILVWVFVGSIFALL